MPGPGCEDPSEVKSRPGDLHVRGVRGAVGRAVEVCLGPDHRRPSSGASRRSPSTLPQAERNHEEAKRLLAEYEQQLAGAADEVRELLEEARRDAEHTKQSILAEAKKGPKPRRRGRCAISSRRPTRAMESLAEQSADLAVDLAGKIVRAQLSKDDHARLIQEAWRISRQLGPVSN